MWEREVSGALAGEKIMQVTSQLAFNGQYRAPFEWYEIDQPLQLRSPSRAEVKVISQH